MAIGRFTGGRPFSVGFDERRQLHRGPSKETLKLRRDLINDAVRRMPDVLLDVLEARGLIAQLVERYNTRVERDRSHGGPRWRRACDAHGPLDPARRSSLKVSTRPTVLPAKPVTASWLSLWLSNYIVGELRPNSRVQAMDFTERKKSHPPESTGDLLITNRRKR